MNTQLKHSKISPIPDGDNKSPFRLLGEQPVKWYVYAPKNTSLGVFFVEQEAVSFARLYEKSCDDINKVVEQFGTPEEALNAWKLTETFLVTRNTKSVAIVADEQLATFVGTEQTDTLTVKEFEEGKDDGDDDSAAAEPRAPDFTGKGSKWRR